MTFVEGPPDHATPHDALFKRTFERPEQATGLVRALLPATLTEAMDLATLEVVPGTFVDLELQELECDLLYRVSLADKPALVYVLLEHQSTYDRRMPWRLLRYMIRVWERWARDNREAHRLPAILPIVVAHGPRPWQGPTSFAELLDLPEPLRAALSPMLVDFRYVLDDLMAPTSEALHPPSIVPTLARLTLFLLDRGRRSNDLLAELREWLPELQQLAASGRDDLVSVLVYIRTVARTARDRVYEFFREQLHAPEDVMSAAEQYLEKMAPFLIAREREEAREEGLRAGMLQGLREGLQKGLEEGREAGRQEGREAGRQEGREAGQQEASRKLLLKQMTLRFGELTMEQEARVLEASNDALEGMIVRILDATSLEDVLG